MRYLIVGWILLTISSEAVVHVIGDSHSQEFANIEQCKIHYLGPRTMHRVGREGLAFIDFRALDVQENDSVVFVFGEIDVRCHIGKQRDLFSRSLEEVIGTLLENYFQTIAINQSLYNHVDVIVYTVTPPVFSTSNIGYESYGSVQDRVLITKMLNQRMIQKAAVLGIGVIDVYDAYADAEGILIPEYSDGSVHIHSSFNQAIRDQLFAH